MHAAQRGVVDDALRADQVGCEAGQAVHGGVGFAVCLRNPFDVEDDPTVHPRYSGRRRGRTWCPRRSRRRPGSGVRVRLGTAGEDLAGGLVDALVARLVPERRCDDFAVGARRRHRPSVHRTGARTDGIALGLGTIGCTGTTTSSALVRRFLDTVLKHGASDAVGEPAQFRSARRGMSLHRVQRHFSPRRGKP